jgi:LemA protein
MNNFISGILVSVEAYPELKSNANFLALQDELSGMENRIKWERDNYNIEVASYKKYVRTFPSNILANMFGFEEDKWDMFEAKEGSQDAPAIDFDK